MVSIYVKSSARGFTLVELLVVITIIGLLASAVLASLSDARAGARDAKRLSELRQFQSALELFRNNNGVYPCSTVNWQWPYNAFYLLDGSEQPGSTLPQSRPAGCSDMRSITPLPKNTFYSGGVDDFLYRSMPPVNGTGYVLRVRMEGQKYFTASNPGGYCIVKYPKNAYMDNLSWNDFSDCFK